MSTLPNINPEDMEFDDVQVQKPKANTFDAKNYLDVKLKEGEDKKDLRIRLLPMGETGSPWKKVWQHTVKVPVEVSPSTWKSYICVKRTEDEEGNPLGDDCPFCQMNHLAYEEVKKSQGAERERFKKLSLENKPTLACIVRCIERGKEADGPKFWKFNVRDDEKDPMHVIKALYNARKQESIDDAKLENNGIVPEDFVPMNIMDLYEGKDLKVTISRVFDKEGHPTDKTSVSIVDYQKTTRVGTDEQIDQWLHDSKKWSDVFVVKPFDYLKVIMAGEVPFYNKELGKWVSKDSMKNANAEEEKAAEQEADTKIKEAEEAVNQAEDTDGDDLPY